MKASILHVSDLHRDAANPVTNEALLHSLRCDLDRYTEEDPAIPPPNLVIVTGDVVQGVKSDTPHCDEELKSQYDQALDFLASVTDLVLDGNRERLVLVPGNHDVSMPQAARSMAPIVVDSALPGSIKTHVKELFAPNSQLRWSWDTLGFFRVADSEVYRRRLEAFATFYAEFYNGRRAYSLEADAQFDVFDYPDYALTIVGFNSCHNNDFMNKPGTLHPDCVARASKQLSARPYRGRLRLAVWHHNVNGSPLRSDYMDADTLQILMDSGFSIGCHGHQHKPQFIDETFRFGAERKITVLSAGTLCGGPTSLPAGHPRCYNILELDPVALVGRLHQRQMANETFGRPIWGSGRFSSNTRSYVDFTVQPPNTRYERADRIADLSDAERLISENRHLDAVPLLRPLLAIEPLARRLLLECYSKIDDAPGIVHEFDPPQSAGEIVHLFEALWATKGIERLRSLLAEPAIVGHNDPAVKALVHKYKARLS